LKEALEESRRTKNPYAEEECLFMLGIISWDLGRIQEAAKFLEDASAHVRTIGLVELERILLKAQDIVGLYNAAKGYRSSNHLRLSLHDFDRAISLAREIGVADFELKCLRQQSLTYWQIGNAEMFLSCNRRGLEIARQLHHRVEEGRCLNNVGVYYEKHSNYSNALRYFEKALLILKGEHDSESEAECLSNMGVTYRELGDYKKAKLYLFQAWETDKIVGNNISLAIDLENIGATCLRQGCLTSDRQEYFKAAEHFERCLSLLRNERNDKLSFYAINNLGLIHLLLGEYEKAQEYFFSALAQSKGNQYTEERCSILNNIANVYLKTGQLKQAISYYLQSEALSSHSKYLSMSRESYFGLGQCYEAQNEMVRALLYYEKSMETIEKIRGIIAFDIFKIGFARNKLSVYQHVLDILFSLYEAHPTKAILDRMFQLVERAKARAFLESLMDARLDNTGPANNEFNEKKKEISQIISKAFWALAKPGLTKDAREQYELKLELAEERYLRMISDAKAESHESYPAAVPEICGIHRAQTQLLDEHTALLEYYVGEKRSYLFVITRNRSELFELPNSQSLQKSLKAYLKMLSTPSGGPFLGIRAAERITRQLAFPLESPGYADIDSLIIVPDGILHYVPYETLRTSMPKGPAFYVEKYDISYCPSASSLLVLKQKPFRSKPLKRLLAFGAPDYKPGGHSGEDVERTPAEVWREIYTHDGFSLPPLPFSKNEVQNVAGNFPSPRKDIFLGDEATESAVKRLPLDEYQIIHFACHGFLDENFPLRSALVLSPDGLGEEDGFLQAREVYDLKMNADLVVLSACQTAGRSLENSEGILGLPRTFFYAGARSVLSSLWLINDKTTASFMGDFYEFLVQGRGKSNALRMAKIRMLRSPHSHPSYWGGFVLYGDPGAIQFDAEFP
jgi:CHAT domain-containing protein/Tfp pilus assembly protein PilF